MTPFQFLRIVLWLLLLMEAATALVAGLWPVSPDNQGLAGDIVQNCLIAAALAGATLLLLQRVRRHG